MSLLVSSIFNWQGEKTSLSQHHNRIPLNNNIHGLGIHRPRPSSSSASPIKVRVVKTCHTHEATTEAVSTGHADDLDNYLMYFGPLTLPALGTGPRLGSVSESIFVPRIAHAYQRASLSTPIAMQAH